MSDDPYFIQKLQLQGFRAFLQPQAFDFQQKRCLAVFAPNGKGKSSIVDALEFMFSDDGTLERLGIRAVNNHAGPSALAHNLAEETKTVPHVLIDFAKGKDVSTAIRPAASGKRRLPESAKTIGRYFVVDPIIRGHSLRKFVETDTPEQRYADVATWLQLGPLVDVQKNLRALRSQVKLAAEDTTALSRIDTYLAKQTANVVLTWDTFKILEYINRAVISPLDQELSLKALDASDAAYVTLTKRALSEERQLGLAGLRQIRKIATALFDRRNDAEFGEENIAGAILVFESTVSNLSNARRLESEERGKAADSVFQKLWQAAEPLFAEGTPDLEKCPVCSTPLADTVAGSTAGIRVHLAEHLNGLASYATAKKDLDRAVQDAGTAQTRLDSALKGLSDLLGDERETLKIGLANYRVAVETWAENGTPDSAPLVDTLTTFISDLNRQINEIEEKQGDHTYNKAKTIIDRLLEIQTERLITERTNAELTEIFQSLASLGTIVIGEIRKKVEALLDTLQTPMNEIYQKIQNEDAAPIRLVLPPEEDVNQQRLNLVIDFAKNRTGVQPGGYLSDSQIHSVALALRIAAIMQFNSGAPIMALDDIVTSYDADHRRSSAALIATMSRHYQVIITTHDERFFNYLKDQLEEKDWHFTRIIRLDPNFGPRFADHKVTDEMIEARWKGGDSAANEMRQAEEEWLLGICQSFGVRIRIRPIEKAYTYERSELALALASFFNDTNLRPNLVPGVSNSFLTSLQRGEIENFGSHFSDAQYGDGSIGDERTRWEEFKIFRSQFACPKCKRTKFKRPYELKKPVCAHRGCETQFEFILTSPLGTP